MGSSLSTKGCPFFAIPVGYLDMISSTVLDSFALTKKGINDACQYSDWLKANWSRARFPPQEDSARKDSPHKEGEGDERPTKQAVESRWQLMMIRPM